MPEYTVYDWFRFSKTRPKMSVSPANVLNVWLRADELSQGFVEIFLGRTPLLTIPFDNPAGAAKRPDWTNVKAVLPQSSLRAATMREPVAKAICCYLGRSSHFIGSCDVPDKLELQPSHLRRLEELADYRDWNVSYVFVEKTSAIVGGWALTPDVDRVPAVHLDGLPALVERRKSAHAAKRFWHLDNSEWFGFEARLSLPVLPQWLRIEMLSSPMETARHARWQYLGKREDLGPLPPEANIKRVSGAMGNLSSYINLGYTEFQTISVIFNRHGVDLDDGCCRVLDWGSGCARVARHLLHLDNGEARTFGIDIDEDNIAWCRRNLSDQNFSKVGLQPPTHFEANTFDAVFAISVLSHLRENDADRWLAELARLLKPGGVAVLTDNGLPSAGVHLASDPISLAKLETDGLLDYRRSDNLDGHIADSEYYRLMFFSDRYIATIFRRHFNLVAVEPCCLAGGQSAAVLKKSR